MRAALISYTNEHEYKKVILNLRFFLSLATFTWTRSVQHENTYVLLKLTVRPISKYTKCSNKCRISLKFYHQHNRIRISGIILLYITKVFQNNFQLKKIVSLAIVLPPLQNSEWTRMIYFRGQKIYKLPGRNIFKWQTVS